MGDDRMRTSVLALDGSWDFVPDPEGRLAPDRLPPGSPILVPGPWEAQRDDPYGIVRGWYRRSFTLPASWPGGTLILRFGSAMARARVWLDGRLVGAHEDGYLPFEVDSGLARPGASHELVVAVDNPVNALTEFPAFGRDAVLAATERLGGASYETMPHGKQAWYTSTSGLLGSVAAACVPDPRLAAVQAVPDLDASLVTVRWRLAGAHVALPARVRLRVTSPRGRAVGDISVDAALGAAVIPIPDPEPWDLGRPALYRLDAVLEVDHATETGDSQGPSPDAVGLRFGMRSIAVRDGSILLNGRSVYLRGALDQDFWPLGMSSAPSRAALEAQMTLAREMGLNLLRCHIKIPDPTYLDVADEAGVLVWCELPSWRQFAVDTAAAARRILARMIDTMGSHPSIVAWTIINENWGTDLGNSARDRRWLRATADWLKASDPSRLVVDNSACETFDGSSFHLRTDLADYHAYRSMPDGMARWRSLVDELAKGPGWLWSPHGDAAPTGDEAIVMSEFGSWGLPRPSEALSGDDRGPWWWRTGGSDGPAGIHRRFRDQGLDRIWPDVDALADATQLRQFDALAFQVRELRRHAAIRGFVVTELADVAWEANGLLDFGRRSKVFHGRLAELLGPEILFIEPPAAELWGGEHRSWGVILAAAPDDDRPMAAGDCRLDWQLRLAEGLASEGTVRIDGWPRDAVRQVARIGADVPDVASVTHGELAATAVSADERTRATFRQAVVVIPSATRRTAQPRRVGVVDPEGLWSIGRGLERLGHEVVAVELADVVVAAQLDRALISDVNRGASLLLLARSIDAVRDDLRLEERVVPRRRKPDACASPVERSWDGDWMSVFAWALPGTLPGLAAGGFLGDAHAEIFPDLVLDWPDRAAGADVVEVGMFSGWVRRPAALLMSFRQGAGHVIVTTLRVAPEEGPVATAVLESLVQRAVAARGRPAGRTSLGGTATRGAGR
jgi:Glycosyl hydrolases family 2, sugar binding domain/Glycosyl hydrolases family 2, TIM barrel domain